MKYLYSVLNLSNFICCQGLSIIAPFFPAFAKSYNVDENIIGLIFSANPVGAIIASLIIGKLLTQKNQYYVMTFGLFIQAIGLLVFPLLPLITSREIFIAVALLARLIEGMGSSMLLTPFYAIIPRIFPEQVESKIAFAEFASSFGYLAGPIFGSILYTLGGFKMPFLFFGVLSISICLVLLKVSIDHAKTKIVHELNDLLVNINEPIMVEVNSNDSTSEDEPLILIGYWNALKNYKIMSSLCAVLIISVLYTFYSPIYSSYVLEEYEIQASTVGYYMATTSIAYSVSTFIVSNIKNHKTFFIFMGLLISGLVQPMMGQDLINLHSIWYTVGAQAVYGFFSAFPYILALPFVNELMIQSYPNQEDKCNQIASALFNACVAFGEFIGPVASGYLTSNFGFERSASVLGLLILMTSLLFIPMIIKKQSKLSHSDDT